MEDRTQTLHKALTDKGLYTKTYEEFTAQFSDPTKRDLLFQALQKKGMYTKTREEFDSQFFPVDEKKKEQVELSPLSSAANGQTVLEDFGQPLNESATEQSPFVSTEKPKEFSTPDLGLQTPSEDVKLTTPGKLVSDYFKGKEMPRDNPEANTLGEKVLSVPGEVFNAFGRLFDEMHGYGNLIEKGFAQMFLGKEGADTYMKAKEKGAFAMPNAMTLHPSKALSNFIATSTEGVKDIPNTTAGNITKGMADLAPDIVATWLFPEGAMVKIAPKLGIQLGKFSLEQAGRGYIEGSIEGQDQPWTKQLAMPVVTSMERGTTAWMYESLGGMNNLLGNKIANKLLPNATTSSQVLNKVLVEHGTATLSDALTFGGLGSLDEFLKTGQVSTETFWTGFGTGAAFHGIDMGKLLTAKGLNTLMAVPSKGLAEIGKSEVSAEKLNKQAEEKIGDIESGKSASVEGDAVMAFMLKKAAQTKAVADEVVNNKAELIQSIQNSSLGSKVQEELIDKINAVDAENDPKIQATQKLTAEIKKIDDALDLIRRNKSWDDTRKEIESVSLKEKKQKLKNKILEAYGQPVEKKEEKKKVKKEEAVPQEVPFTEITSENISEIEKNTLSSIPETETEEVKRNFEHIKQSVNERAAREKNPDPMGEYGEDATGRISEIQPSAVEGDGGSYQGLFRGRRDLNREPRVTPEEQVSNLVAPNGEKSNLSPENHAFVRTPEFIQKFGDWQKGEGSLVLDANGEPLLVYSGKGKYHLKGIDPTKTKQKVLYFTGSKKLAALYGRLGGKQPVVYRGFLNIKEGDLESGSSQINKFHDSQQEYVITKKDQFIPVGVEEVPKLKKNSHAKDSRKEDNEVNQQVSPRDEQGGENVNDVRNNAEERTSKAQGKEDIGSVPVSEMNGEQLREYAKKIKSDEASQEERFFGKEGAKRYREAQAISNSATATTERRKEAYKVIDELEGSLTQEQRDEWDGVTEGKKRYDPSEIRDIAERVELVEQSQNVDELAGALKLPLLTFINNPKDEGTLAVLRATRLKTSELGLSPQDVLKSAIKRIAKDLPDNTDLAEITRDIIGKITQGATETVATEQPRLEASQSHSLTAENNNTQNKGDASSIVPPQEGTISSGNSNLPPEQIPPDSTPISEGRGEKRKMEVARKAVEESMKLSDKVKQDLKDEGIEYVVKHDTTLDSEVEELVRLHGTDPAGLDALQSMVTNPSEGMSGDRRNWLTALLIDERSKQIASALTYADKVTAERKIKDLIIFAGEQGVFAGREVRSFRKIGEALERYPEAIRASVIAKLDKQNREFYDKNQLDKIIRKEVDEYFKNRQPKETKDYVPDIEVSKEKIRKEQEVRAELWKQLKDSFKKPGASLSAGVLPLSAEQVEIVSKIVGSYIKQGYYQTEIIARKLRKDWEDMTGDKITDDDVVKILPKEVEGKTLDQWDAEGKEFKQQKGERKQKKEKVKKQPTEEELVDRLLAKAAKIATRKQLQNFVSKYLTEIADKGILSDQEFRNVLSEALGKDYVSERSEGIIDKAAKAVSESNKMLTGVQKAFDEYSTEYDNNPKSEKLLELKDNLNKAIKDSDRAMTKAKREWQRVQLMLQGEPDALSRLNSMVQGGLLIPSSQIVNFVGNLTIIPETAPAYLIAGGMDALASRVGKATQNLISKIDPVKYPDIYRNINKFAPTEERTIMPMKYLKGYGRGMGKGWVEGFSQAFSKEGVVGTELMKGTVMHGIHPVDAFMHIYNTATGKERRSLAQFGVDILEALPAGYLTNAQFRGLNLFDLPFRSGGESGILYESFGIKWQKKIEEANKIKDPTERKERLDYLNGIEDVEREKFYRSPDATTIELAKKQGAKGTFSQKSALTNAINSFERYAMEHKGTREESMINGALRMLKMLNMPYVVVPINYLGKSIEMGSPVFPLFKMSSHFIKALKAKEQGNMENAHMYRRMTMEDFGNAVVGTMITGAALSLAMAGVISWGSEDKKIKAAQQDIGKEGLRFNADAFKRYISGGDPTWQEGDDTYTMKRLGIVSVQFGSIAQAVGDMTAEERNNLRGAGLIDKYSTALYQSMLNAPNIALQQGVMTGVNQMVQGLMGSEYEKDRWIIGMSQALSTVVYPNTLANLSQSYDGYFRETRDVTAEDNKISIQLKNTFKDRMFASKTLPAKISIWGQEIRRIPEGESPFLYGVLGVAKHRKYQQYSFGAKVYNLWNEYKDIDPEIAKQVIPSQVDMRTKVGWDNSLMTPDQLNTFQKIVGKLRAEEAEMYTNSQEWEDATMEERADQLSKIYAKARKTAEAELFSWNAFKEQHPEEWNTMLNQEALPLPSIVTKIEDYKLTPEDTKQLNEIALKYYSDDSMPYLKLDPKILDQDRKGVDDKTGQSYFVGELNKYWQKALKSAKLDMRNLLEVRDNKLAKIQVIK